MAMHLLILSLYLMSSGWGVAMARQAIRVCGR